MHVFLDLLIIFSFFTIQGLNKSTIQKSASFPIDKLPLSIFNIFAGLLVKHWIILDSFKDSLWNNSRARDNKVSIPDAPVAAWENVNLFDSSSSGLWSETMTSIKSWLIPFINESLSSSVRSGGESFKKVLKSPISFSLSDKLLIETPVVKFTLSLLRLITSKDFAEDICEIWYLQL